MSIALGIAANLLVFAIVDAVLLHPFPYRDPSQLVFLWGTKSDEVRRGISAPDLQDWRAQNHSFVDIAPFLEQLSFTVGDGGDTVTGACIGSSVLPILGVRPALGRNFTVEETSGAGQPVVIVSDGFWRSRMGASQTAIGSQILLNSRAFEVVGVTPRDFFFPDTNSQILEASPCGMANFGDRGAPVMHAIGRLRIGASVAQAQADLDLINRRLARVYPEADKNLEVGLQPLRNIVVGKYERALWLLLAAVGVVLLIACANVAHLQLARGMDRQAELAVRAAMGADRRRLFTQLITESAVIASAGALCAFAAAWSGIRIIRALSLSDISRLDAARVDLRLVGVAALLAVVVTIVSGTWPAWKSAGIEVNSALKIGPGTVTSGANSVARELLATTELALATVLLVVAGLLVGSFVRLSTATWGFNPTNLLSATITTPPIARASVRAFTDWSEAVRARVQALPGVKSAVVADGLPLAYAWWPTQVRVDGRLLSAGEWTVGYGYFHTLGASMREGREFNGHDDESAERVAVINEALARRLWPGRSPLGRHFDVIALRVVDGKLASGVEARLRRGDESVFSDPAAAEAITEKVIGVVENIRAFGLDHVPEPAFYTASSQVLAGRGVVVAQRIAIRTSDQASGILKALTPAILSVDPTAQVHSIEWMSDLVAHSIGGRGSPRLMMLVSVLFGTVALLLAMSGIFGIVLHTVTQRMPEIGVRIALGAGGADVARLLFGYVGRMIIAGTVLGAAIAWASARVLTAFVFGVTPRDPATYVVSISALIAGVLGACVVPIRRAMRCDPTVLLRA